MKNFKQLLVLFLCAFIIIAGSGCDKSPDAEPVSFFAMDTYIQLDVRGNSFAADEIKDEILSVESLLSPTDENSDIYKLNQSGSAVVDDVTASVLDEALHYCRETDGALDITVYPVICEWGFINGNYKIPKQEKIDEMLQFVDYNKVSAVGSQVKLENGVQIDMGAVAKGFAADSAVKILDKNSVSSAILNLGGTVAAYGKKSDKQPWKVGIADPENSADYMGYLQCENKIIATSGSYERYFEGEDGKTYSHIIDPATGQPVDNGILSVTVISDSGVRCDCLSTALFVMGLDKAVAYQNNHNDFDFVILTDDGKAYVTSGIESDFVLADNAGYEKTVVG